MPKEDKIDLDECDLETGQELKWFFFNLSKPINHPLYKKLHWIQKLSWLTLFCVWIFIILGIILVCLGYVFN